jgi:hypothetical protein
MLAHAEHVAFMDSVWEGITDISNVVNDAVIGPFTERDSHLWQVWGAVVGGGLSYNLPRVWD